MGRTKKISTEVNKGGKKESLKRERGKKKVGKLEKLMDSDTDSSPEEELQFEDEKDQDEKEDKKYQDDQEDQEDQEEEKEKSDTTSSIVTSATRTPVTSVTKMKITSIGGYVSNTPRVSSSTIPVSNPTPLIGRKEQEEDSSWFFVEGDVLLTLFIYAFTVI